MFPVLLLPTTSVMVLTVDTALPRERSHRRLSFGQLSTTDCPNTAAVALRAAGYEPLKPRCSSCAKAQSEPYLHLQVAGHCNQTRLLVHIPAVLNLCVSAFHPCGSHTSAFSSSWLSGWCGPRILACGVALWHDQVQQQLQIAILSPSF